MTTPIPFVPTPRLSYTLQLNEFREDYAEYRQTQQREQQQLEAKRLEEYQRKQRVEELLKLREDLEQHRQYTALAKQQGYWDYKYAYYVGTLIDQYI